VCVEPPVEDVPKRKQFVKPTVSEVAEYCKARNNGLDAESFVAFYDSKGWRIGNNPMKQWRAAVITWEKRTEARAPPHHRIAADKVDNYQQYFRADTPPEGG